MAALEEKHKRFIVQELACFRSPSEVVDRVKEEFGLDITRQQVRSYNPLQVEEVAEKWRAVFAATREAYLKKEAEIGISHAVYRLEIADQRLKRAVKKNLDGLVKDFLEYAAKETGGSYTNHRTVAGSVSLVEQLLNQTEDEGT